MILVIDNYDSFTYNLVQYLRELGCEVIVQRNDALDCAAAVALKPAALVLSPGGGAPAAAGISGELVDALAGRVPILGVGLGLHIIATRFGAQIVPSPALMHGKVSEITCDGRGIFHGLADRPFKGMRYHSHQVECATLPAHLVVSASSSDAAIMGVRHRDHQIDGLQFHPESIMTPVGKRILRNFIKQL